MSTDSVQHSGSKYLRTIYPAGSDNTENGILVDVYEVIESIDLRCAARQHALKKLLFAGMRGKGSQVKDLEERRDAISRAIQMQKRRGKIEEMERDN